MRLRHAYLRWGATIACTHAESEAQQESEIHTAQQRLCNIGKVQTPQRIGLVCRSCRAANMAYTSGRFVRHNAKRNWLAYVQWAFLRHY